MTQERSQDVTASLSFADEVASAITHGVGAALSIAGLTALVILAVLYGDGWHITSVTIYGVTLVFLYLASTLYHSIQVRPVKQVFHILDHVGIATLIAGTYTPFLLVKMRTAQGWTFFALIWGLALIISCIKAFHTGRYTKLSTIAYVVMGWLSIFLIGSFVEHFGIGALIWMAVGGLAYSLGVIPFLWTSLPFNHAIWHLFVIAGSACHYVAISWYVLPLS